jgi:hypothetical protein
MKSLILVGILLAQVGSCNIPEGDVELKDCLPEDQREGYECKVVYIGGKLIKKTYYEIPKPSPSPSTNPLPSPSASPIIIPSPKPSPSPSTSPEQDAWCKIEEDGNFGLPPENGTCPPCWLAAQETYGPIISYWGLAFRSKTPCNPQNRDANGNLTCPLGLRVNVDKTPHSKKPFLPHRRGGGSETLRGCQPAIDSLDIPDIWVYPPNSDPGYCDNFSGSRYWCHHKPQSGQVGPTKFEIQAPGKRSIIVPVP